MQPQQPAPASLPEDPYGFIMNGGAQPPKRNLFAAGGNSPLKRITILGGGAAVLITLIFMLFSLLFGGGQGQTDKLLSIAQQQTELIRISDLTLNGNSSQTPATVNLASSISLSLTSSRQQILGLMSKANRSKSEKQLGLKQDSATDKKLTVAKQNSNYDPIFIGVMKNQLTAYQSSIKQAHSSSKNSKEKQVLDSAYQGVTLLLSQTK